MDLRPHERDGRELGEVADRVVVHVDVVLRGNERDKELGSAQQAQVLQVDVDLESPVLGGREGLGRQLAHGGGGERDLRRGGWSGS